MAIVGDLPKLFASTLEDWIDGGALQDTVFVGAPYLDMMNRAGMIDKISGPKEFAESIRTGRNTNFQYYKGDETWTTEAIRGYTQGRWESRQSVMPWRINSEEIIYNNGGDDGKKLWDVLMEIKSNTTKSLSEDINVRLLNRNHEDIPDDQRDFAYCWNSLYDLVGDELSDLVEIGNNSAADSFWWRSLIKRPGYSLPKDPRREGGWTRKSNSNRISGGDYDGWQRLILADITAMLMKLHRYYKDGWICLTTQEIITKIIDLVKAEVTTTNTDLKGTLVAGHDGVIWMGCAFVWDDAVGEGDMFFVHPKTVRFRAISERWMKSAEPIQPHNQDTLYGKVFAWGQQYTKERRALGKFEKVCV